LVAEAVNVTITPAQTGLEEAMMLTAGVALALTSIVTVFDVAVVGTAHVALDVITNFMESLFDSEDGVYEIELVPLIAVPFLYH
jgi:hypothetical protein